MNVLVALALLLQESPETAFNRCEANIEKAKSVRVLFTVMPSNEPENLSRGTMTIDGDTAARMSADLRNTDGSRYPVWSEFANGKIRSSLAGHQIEVKGEGRAVRANLNVYLSRLGIFAGALFEHGFRAGASRRTTEISAELKNLFVPTNFVALGEGKNGTKGLSYSFNPIFKPMPFAWAKIWYDPNQYRIVRREVAFTNNGKEEILLEEYEIHLDDDKVAAPEGTAGPARTSLPPTPPRTEAEQDILFIQAKIQVANEHLQNGRKQKAIDVLEDLALSFPKHPLLPEIKRLLEEAKKK
jgi:hypothetical protein